MVVLQAQRWGDDEVLTVEEVAKLLHASPWTIRLWVRQGRLPMAVRVGRRWLFLKSRVIEWLDSGGRAPFWRGPRAG